MLLCIAYTSLGDPQPELQGDRRADRILARMLVKNLSGLRQRPYRRLRMERIQDVWHVFPDAFAEAGCQYIQRQGMKPGQMATDTAPSSSLMV